MKIDRKQLTETMRDMISPEQRKELGIGEPIKIDSARIKQWSQAVTDERTEKELQNLICNYLRQRGIVFGWSPMNKKSTYTEGWPDFSFMWQGRAIFIECKVGRNDLSPYQDLVRINLQNNGGEYFVVRHFEEVKRILDGNL